MKKWFIRLAWFVLGLFIAAQFYPRQSNVGKLHGAEHLAAVVEVPAEVEAILVKACYDCHGSQTRYPWYAHVQPMRWWLDGHVADGKRHLNFSEFARYEDKKRRSKLQAVADEVDEGHMPLASYTWAHRDAVLTEQERAAIVAWVDAVLEEWETQ